MPRFPLLLLALPLAIAGSLAGDQAMAPIVGVTAADCDEYRPAVAYSSVHDEHLVVWGDNCPAATPPARIWARRFDRYGRPLGDVFPVAPTDDLRNRVDPAVTYDPLADRYLVVYGYHFSSTDFDIRARFLPWNGVDPAWGEFPVAQTDLLEVGPAIAYSTGSERYLVAYSRENALGRYEVWGALFGFGAVPVPFPITPSEPDLRVRPAVSYDSVWNEFVVAYDNAFDVFSRGVDAESGTVGIEATLSTTLDHELSAAAASCGGDQHLVTWFRGLPAIDNDVQARFLLGSGAIDGGVVAIAASAEHEDSADLDCMREGGDFLVVYVEELPAAGFGLSARRIAPSKDIRPRFPVIAAGAGETLDAFEPAVSASRDGWLVVWEQERAATPPHYRDLFARKVWDLFADGLEWGNLDAWSLVGP